MAAGHFFASIVFVKTVLHVKIFLAGGHCPPDHPLKRSFVTFDRGGQTGPRRSNDFFSAPLTTRAPPTTVRPDVWPDVRPNARPGTRDRIFLQSILSLNTVIWACLDALACKISKILLTAFLPHDPKKMHSLVTVFLKR